MKVFLLLHFEDENDEPMNNHKRKREHIDSSEMFKRRSLTSRRKRKIIAKFLYFALCVLAIIIFCACIISYLFDL